MDTLGRLTLLEMFLDRDFAKFLGMDNRFLCIFRTEAFNVVASRITKVRRNNPHLPEELLGVQRAMRLLAKLQHCIAQLTGNAEGTHHVLALAISDLKTGRTVAKKPFTAAMPERVWTPVFSLGLKK